MGTKYTTQGRTGFDSSPPPDDGSTGSDNLVTWAKHKSKLALPIANQVDAIDAALVNYVDRTPTAKAVAYPTVASDHLKIIETTGTTTITLGTASTMGAGYEVTVKCVSGATTVATGQTIDGSASNRTLNPGEAETYVVNNAGSAYMIKDNKAITQTETATMSNKTLTSPVLNGTLSGTAFLDEDDMASDSAIAAASQQSIKEYVRGKIAIVQYQEASGGTADTYSATTWNIIDLNTEVSDDDSLVTLATKQFTPISGTYLLTAAASFFDAGSCAARIRVWNDTAGTAVAYGVQAFTGGVQTTEDSTIMCKFTANGTDAYELQLYTSAACTAGTVMTTGQPEIYAQVMLEKIG